MAMALSVHVSAFADATDAPRQAELPLAVATEQKPYVDAYISLYPLYEMARLRHVALEDATNPRRHDLHSFNHLRRLLTHADRSVTGPNNDTLYSSARLDLRQGPVSIELPKMQGRYYSLHFMNFYTENIAILGSRNIGDGPNRITVAGPERTGPTPAAESVVKSDTNDVWLLIRVLVDGPDDLKAVAGLQDQMRIVAPAEVKTYPTQRVAPAKEPTPEQFLMVVNEFLERNPPQGAYQAQIRKLSPLGIAPGKTNSCRELPEDVRNAWNTAWPSATAALRISQSLFTKKVAGWEYPPPELGRWGSNLLLRATVALRGIAALDASEAIYLPTYVDSNGNPLTGKSKYRVRIPPGGIPVDGFWSMTLYEETEDGRFFLAANPIQRYSIGNRTRGLVKNPDGSLDILVQNERPADIANWLPSPTGPFRLTLRAYLPKQELLDATAPLPVVLRAD